ncbi:Hsp20/alpha crystallin family protein [Streptomyces asiaticus]|uniref:Hsp20/alpha crystallin family protein n=1 Tax=Streptomyces asiaticus TaxID=114695 RepID=UPI001BA9DEBB|nr:Hsp20/alpha crystallin family protein [Streptomyces asiaticus]
MTLPVRRVSRAPLAERRHPGWTTGPLAEFDDLFSRMGSLLESTVGSLTPMTEGTTWSPSADVSETDDAYQIEAGLPGVKREDVDIEMAGQELVISGELKERERADVLRRGTRRTGRFEYRALLPGEIDADSVRAALHDGVLSVEIPKVAAAKPRHIEITTGD